MAAVSSTRTIRTAAKITKNEKLKALVVGSGAVGLRTALELLHRNVSVILQAPRPPLHPKTCSVGAGGLWMPVHCTDPRTDRWAIETLDEHLSTIQQQQDEANKNPYSLVELLYAVDLKREHSGPSEQDFRTASYQKIPGQVTPTSNLPGWTSDARIHFQHLTVEMLDWQNKSNYKLRIPPLNELYDAGYLYAWLWRTPVVNAPKMLQHYLEQVTQHALIVDVNVETGHEYQSMPEMIDAARELGCDALFNCTGLGASNILPTDDESNLIGGRGVTLRFDRKSAVRRQPVLGSVEKSSHTNDCVVMTSDTHWARDEANPCYLIPRGDTIIVGGTMLPGDAETGIREEEREQLLQNASRLGINVHQSPPASTWTGFRPYRSQGVRCELDAKYSTVNNKNVGGGFKVIHNYGHGGSGWTINVGTAKECVNLLFSK